jgi:hypothetical protein
MSEVTLQSIFNRVATHLLKQGKRATVEKTRIVPHLMDGNKCVEEKYDVCMYRTPDGSKCAAGCLIKDEFYKPEIEGYNVESVDYVIPALRQSLDDPDNFIDVLGLVVDLQKVHDFRAPGLWKVALRVVASDYGLDAAVLERA